MRHRAHARFWRCYKGLPRAVQQAADRSYALLRSNPNHPSLQFKKVGQFWSSRIGRHYRALALELEEDLVWFWIGSHADYDVLVGRRQKRAPATSDRSRRKTRRKRR